MSYAQVYHEKQDAGLCGVHCLNNLLQGLFYSAIDLMHIALALDEKEKLLMAQGGMETSDFIKFVAEDSGNVADDGNYSVQVLAEALKFWNLNCIAITSPEMTSARENPQHEEAFICNHASHWLAIRQINKNWWNLNSLLKQPQYLSEIYLGAFLKQLEMEGYAIFVIKGAFPRPDATQIVSNMVRAKVPHKGNESIQTTYQGNFQSEDDAIQQAIAMSLAEHEKPGKKVDEEDLSLQEAIALSKSLQDIQAPEIKELEGEPGPDTPDSFLIAVSLPDGKQIQRRFMKLDRLQMLFDLLHKNGINLYSNTYKLISNTSKDYNDPSQTFLELGLYPKPPLLCIGNNK